VTNPIRVSPDQLAAAGAGWSAQAFELHAAPPSLQMPTPWPTMLASAAVTGAAQGATADLHTRITGTAAATQLAAVTYTATDTDGADAINDVISAVTDAVKQAT